MARKGHVSSREHGVDFIKKDSCTSVRLEIFPFQDFCRFGRDIDVSQVDFASFLYGN